MLRGQWTGPYAGSDSGEAIIEFDEIDGKLVGTAGVYSNNPLLPPTYAEVVAPLKATTLKQTVPIFPIDMVTGDPVDWATLSRSYPASVSMSSSADTIWVLSGGTLYVSWVTPVSHGLAVLTQGTPSAASNKEPEPIANWTEFKSYVSSLEPDRYIFRGQSDSNWRLRSSFHRAGRADLRRFMKQDVQRLHRSLSGLTSHFFDLSKGVENGAFCTLAQHHGYPTPLLDWTFSPYVGAYFAYRNLEKSKRTDDHKVRIIMFDGREWLKLPQIDRFIGVRRHFSLMAPLALNNTRLIPQQAVLSISNVDDIERYIEELEVLRYRTYLRVIDLPGSERAQVMQELRMMGITSGSLFPGLDGACEQLREQHFDL